MAGLGERKASVEIGKIAEGQEMRAGAAKSNRMPFHLYRQVKHSAGRVQTSDFILYSGIYCRYLSARKTANAPNRGFIAFDLLETSVYPRKYWGSREADGSYTEREIPMTKAVRNGAQRKTWRRVLV